MSPLPALGGSTGAEMSYLQADGGAQLGGAVDALPGEVGLGAAEVTVRGRLRVDRAQQVEAGDDRPRPQVEDLGDRVLDPLHRHPLGAEALDEEPDRLGLADRVRDLHLAGGGPPPPPPPPPFPPPPPPARPR